MKPVEDMTYTELWAEADDLKGAIQGLRDRRQQIIEAASSLGSVRNLEDTEKTLRLANG